MTFKIDRIDIMYGLGVFCLAWLRLILKVNKSSIEYTARAVDLHSLQIKNNAVRAQYQAEELCELRKEADGIQS